MCAVTCCVPVAIPATWSFLCSVWFVAAFAFEISGRVWAAMVSKHNEGSPGFRDRSGPKRSWQMPLRLMARKNGYVSSVPQEMCGPGGVADDVTLTSQLVCRENRSRPSSRRTKDGIQDHLLELRGRERVCWRCSVNNKERRRAPRCTDGDWGRNGLQEKVG